MRLPLLISLSLLFVTQAVRAQLAPANDFFNRGAQFYISNNIPSALEQVEAGLKIYPDDGKLKKLEELLKQKQQQQNQQQQDQQQKQQDQKNQNQQNQSQQQKDQQSQQQKSDDQKNQQQQNQQSARKDSQNQPKPDEQKKDQSGEKKDEQQKQQEEQKSSADKKDGEKPDKPDAAGRPLASGQMTPEEAKHLLDAQKGDEKVLQMQPKGKPANPSRPVKDW
jgi:Ca-activated chloride channel homolog